MNKRIPRKIKKLRKKQNKLACNIAQNLAVLFSAADNSGNAPVSEYIKSLILSKCSAIGVTKSDIAKIDYNDKFHTATITMNDAAHITMFVEGEENGNN